MAKKYTKKEFDKRLKEYDKIIRREERKKRPDKKKIRNSKRNKSRFILRNRKAFVLNELLSMQPDFETVLSNGSIFHTVLSYGSKQDRVIESAVKDSIQSGTDAFVILNGNVYTTMGTIDTAIKREYMRLTDVQAKSGEAKKYPTVDSVEYVYSVQGSTFMKDGNYTIIVIDTSN